MYCVDPDMIKANARQEAESNAHSPSMIKNYRASTELEKFSHTEPRHPAATFLGAKMSLQPWRPAPGSEPKKRKNILTGHAEEIAVSDITFKTQHRKYLQRNNKPDAPAPAKRQRGDASIVSGDGAYKGPWAKFEGDDEQYSEEEGSLASDEEYEEEGTVAPGPSATAPMPKASTAYASDDPNSETTEFHGITH